MLSLLLLYFNVSIYWKGNPSKASMGGDNHFVEELQLRIAMGTTYG